MSNGSPSGPAGGRREAVPLTSARRGVSRKLIEIMVGRKDEQARLQALLDAAREGRSGTLLLHGPAGIGKTELLRYAVTQAEGFRVLRARGMETESDIPFAGLAELVTPL